MASGLLPLVPDHHWITLRLEGVQSNRSAIGARVKVSVESETGIRDICATVSSGGSFGASALQQVIGLGKAQSIRSIEVRWPRTGKVQVFKDIKMDQILKIREGEAPIPIRLKSFRVSGDGKKTTTHTLP
jgi:hypothetical protein